MSARARLAAASGVALLASATALYGSRMTWWTEGRPGGSFELGGRTAELPAATHSTRVGDALPEVGAIAVILVLASIALFLVGPRARALLVVVIAGCALAVVVRLTWSDAEPTGAPNVTYGRGRAVATTGAIIAGLAGVAAGIFGRRIPRFGLPESGPDLS